MKSGLKLLILFSRLLRRLLLFPSCLILGTSFWWGHLFMLLSKFQPVNIESFLVHSNFSLAYRITLVPVAMPFEWQKLNIQNYGKWIFIGPSSVLDVIPRKDWGIRHATPLQIYWFPQTELNFIVALVYIQYQQSEREKNTSNKTKINSNYDFMNPPYECG